MVVYEIIAEFCYNKIYGIRCYIFCKQVVFYNTWEFARIIKKALPYVQSNVSPESCQEFMSLKNRCNTINNIIFILGALTSKYPQISKYSYQILLIYIVLFRHYLLICAWCSSYWLNLSKSKKILELLHLKSNQNPHLDWLQS